MDAREQLRRYLEQRREMGETELVLDSMTVEETLRLLGAKPVAMSAATAQSGDTVARSAAPTAEVRPGGSDWREALRATGASPGGPKAASDAPPTPATEPLPGLSLGPRSVEMSGGEAAFTAMASLEEIAKAVEVCTRCSLYKTATHAVPGEGNPDADFMLVGEAPGAMEDQTGRPFVGPAGQLLTKILEAIGLKREDVYIANVIKHRPPGNRNPMPDEIRACSPYLLRQIDLVRPKVILALGTFAAQTLLETKLSIGKLRGQIHQFHGVPLVVTYHPAALLRNPSWKRPTWEDVQLARSILDSAVPPA